jgi:hypothetical protein
VKTFKNMMKKVSSLANLFKKLKPKETDEFKTPSVPKETLEHQCLTSKAITKDSLKYYKNPSIKEKLKDQVKEYFHLGKSKK